MFEGIGVLWNLFFVELVQYLVDWVVSQGKIQRWKSNQGNIVGF